MHQRLDRWREPPWPDVPAGIATLRSKSLELGILSNFADAMLRSDLAKAYAMGENTLNLPRNEITYVAFARDGTQLARPGLAIEHFGSSV